MYKSTSFRSRRKFSRCRIPKALNNSLETEKYHAALNIVASIVLSEWVIRHIHAPGKACSPTVFPAPLGPTSTVRGEKKEMTCMSLSSIPKLLTPKMLILSIFDMFAPWKTDRNVEGEADEKNRQCYSNSATPVVAVLEEDWWS